jgi:hypothetical protein
MDSIFLRSVRMDDPGTDRPDNYDELLERLIQESRQNRLTCARCLRFYQFDYDVALKRLMERD